jgi:hypothetical protein
VVIIDNKKASLLNRKLSLVTSALSKARADIIAVAANKTSVIMRIKELLAVNIAKEVVIASKAKAKASHIGSKVAPTLMDTYLYCY